MVLAFAVSDIKNPLDMDTLTFSCEVITPMFLAGADGEEPELRPSAIKAGMRFWWRAMNAQLVGKNKEGKPDYAPLRAKETKIFGGTGEGTGQRSCFSIQIESGQRLSTPKIPLVAHRKGDKAAFSIRQQFNVIFRVQKNDHFSKEQLNSLFLLTMTLGSLGKRARRGFGSCTVKGETDKMLNSYASILQHLEVINKGNFYIAKDRNGRDCILSRFTAPPQYPCIKQIQIGRPQGNLPVKVSDVMHKVHQDNVRDYDHALGHAGRGRFASPVYVSAILSDSGATQSIITTLNAVPNQNFPPVNLSLQEEFKNKIL
jgi:CRISPR-associated protein Cmr1